MSNDLELYHNILFIDCPWLDNTTSGQKYQQMLHTVSKENYAQQPRHELSFIKALTPERKYYHALIDNEARRYINAIHSLVNNASNENEKKYWVHLTLTRKLKDKFEETEKIIKSRQLYFSVINDKSESQKQKDDAYVLQLLKYELIRLYLEIQGSFPSYLKEEPITEADIHSTHFNSEDAPEKSFIIQAPDYNLPKPTNVIVVQPEKKKFNVIKADIRDLQKGVLKYEEIISKRDRFALAEEELFKSDLIDADYKFKKKHGNIEKMAAVYHILIQKQHFTQFYFSEGRKKITDLHIRRFLNHRYATNIDKEFRKFRTKQAFDDYINNNSALPLIIPS